MDGLHRDLKNLHELKDQWAKVTVDPKLENFIDLLKNEVFRKDLNPTGKLVIFTESTDTADYLEENLEKHDFRKVLSVSSKNRNKTFETIQQNFDANYDGVQSDEYAIILTTDILAEGVNLHRANVIINYDTPWNATRLMQRIGRVNRIGSVSNVIYNYSFYPSQQGDDEIHLYNNALVKLQGFHSAFGEDAQIFTHEEVGGTIRTFEQGMPDDEDKRLYFYGLSANLKTTTPKSSKD